MQLWLVNSKSFATLHRQYKNTPVDLKSYRFITLFSILANGEYFVLEIVLVIIAHCYRLHIIPQSFFLLQFALNCTFYSCV